MGGGNGRAGPGDVDVGCRGGERFASGATGAGRVAILPPEPAVPPPKLLPTAPPPPGTGIGMMIVHGAVGAATITGALLAGFDAAPAAGAFASGNSERTASAALKIGAGTFAVLVSPIAKAGAAIYAPIAIGVSKMAGCGVGSFVIRVRRTEEQEDILGPQSVRRGSLNGKSWHPRGHAKLWKRQLCEGSALRASINI